VDHAYDTTLVMPTPAAFAQAKPNNKGKKKIKALHYCGMCIG
jgi:hypothetical protein